MADDRLLDHVYDGIQEYDNPCPRWWYLVLWATVLFSPLYFLFFHVGSSGWTLSQSYDQEVADNLNLRFAEIGELTADEPTLLKYMHEPDWLAIGTGVYSTHCKSCHAADGSGLVGPNLTDDVYKNVRSLADIAKIVEDGAAGGSMPAWRNRLHPNEIVLVSAYVAGLRGKNLPGPRGAEGKAAPPWPKGKPDGVDLQ
ncbi:MAG: c-type cytochrome [Pirellulales bacterium]|nr:c-type cytochrome [Pirellulales bacterium]